MKYIFLQSDKEKNWLELDNNNYAYRQIILDKNDVFHISCKEDCLAEGEINECDLEGNITYLSAKEFNDIWKHVLKKYMKQWEETKNKYHIGTYIKCIHDYVYPQGIIVRGKDFIAAYLGNEEFCIGKIVQYKVIAYDEINMWLIVK